VTKKGGGFPTLKVVNQEYDEQEAKGTMPSNELCPNCNLLVEDWHIPQEVQKADLDEKANKQGP
jgi:hypothetical protein